jgi:Spy/CpxP family protein refolding chaperone
MKHTLLAAAGLLWLAGSAYADDPPQVPTTTQPAQPPRTHIDTTVVGDTTPDNSGAPADAVIQDNDHDFKAGAPDLVRVTQQLNLSPQQKAQLNDAIERADAGAAVLIKRERDVRDMIAATTPQDPLYAKLIADQAAAADRWTENREGLRREVANLLTPAQRARFDALQDPATRQSKD